MRFVGQLLIAVVGTFAMHAQPARAVDITGTWTVCLSNAGGPFCPAGLIGVLTSAGGLYTLTITDQAAICTITGAVNPTTGALSVDPGSCTPYLLGMSATATDTSITGTIDLGLCPTFAIAGAKVCGTCDDSNPCTVDGCGGTPCSSSSCTYGQNYGGSCDDGDVCTVGDTCNAGTCVASPTPCDDGNPCTNDACDAGSGLCVYTPNANPCNDFNACTTNDTCNGGTCTGSHATCDRCERCGLVSGCVVGPRPACRQSTNPAKSKILLKDHPNDAGDKVAWTWGAGEATAPGDFGNPVGGDDYDLCVFDGPSASPRLLIGATAPAGGTCAAGTSCWLAKGNPPGTTGFLYKDTGLLLPDGMKRVTLKPGLAGKAKATVKGQGANLALPSPMNVTLPVTVQLQAANGECFETVFTTARTDREDLFKATGPPSAPLVAR